MSTSTPTNESCPDIEAGIARPTPPPPPLSTPSEESSFPPRGGIHGEERLLDDSKKWRDSDNIGDYEDDGDDDDEEPPPAPFDSAEFEVGNAEKWAALSTARAQIESTSDDESPPVPFDSAEFEIGNAEKWAAAASSIPRAQIESTSDDESAPAPFDSTEFEVGNAQKWAASSTATVQIESMRDNTPPAPFDLGAFAFEATLDFEDALLKDATRGIAEEDFDIVQRPGEEIENVPAMTDRSPNSNQVSSFLAGGDRGGVDAYPRSGPAFEPCTDTMNRDRHAPEEEKEDARDFSPPRLVRSDLERDSTFLVPEATLVREEEVYMATPAEPPLPWWKHWRTRCLLATMIVMVIAFSIALTLGLRRKNMDKAEDDEPDTKYVDNSPSPSISTTPSANDFGMTSSPVYSSEACKINPYCGATLETWAGIYGDISISDLMSGANTLEDATMTERLGLFLEAPHDIGDYYGIRMKGWFIPPVTGNYVFYIASDDIGELWLSSDDHPDNIVRLCFVNDSTSRWEWDEYAEQESKLIALVAGEAYYFEALMKEEDGQDNLAIAWEYPGQYLEVIPAIYSRTVKPGWPVNCANDSECDDGVWCNGEEICSDGVCKFGTKKNCSDGLLCTDDICIESTRSCENPTSDCLSLDDPWKCATDQCIETLGGCQFSCGAVLETWQGTLNLDGAPSRMERLGYLLEAPSNRGDFYMSRMKGWLIPPVSGNYVFWIAADNVGELWLSSDDHPDNIVRHCLVYELTGSREWNKYPQQNSTSIELVADKAYYFEVLMGETDGKDYLAVAWEYPGQDVEVIPAMHLRMAKPGWPATCANDSDCDDGVWCNGEEICSGNICKFGTKQTCSDGLLCTDDRCIESTRSCEYTATVCLPSNDACAIDQCIETLGGCQFSCGAVLETWTGIPGTTVFDLVNGTNNFTDAPGRTERLGSLLEAPYTMSQIYGSRMKGWLIPPVTDNYVFYIASDDEGELWLSSDYNPDNKVLICHQQWASGPRYWESSSEQKSTLIALVAGETYYFEALVKDGGGTGFLSIAWQYPGQILEVVPAKHSRLTNP